MPEDFVYWDELENEIPEGSQLFIDGNRGVYIPRDFAVMVERSSVSGVVQEDWDVLEMGPDHELYWEAWEAVLNNAVLEDGGEFYNLHQDGDLWLVPRQEG